MARRHRPRLPTRPGTYWADGFDWHEQETALNALPHYRAVIAGRAVHFLHLPAARPAGAPAPLPLILSHGWPSSFVEMLPLADRLANPGRYGNDPGNAFDVVVPSLPGFLYSELLIGPSPERCSPKRRTP